MVTKLPITLRIASNSEHVTRKHIDPFKLSNLFIVCKIPLLATRPNARATSDFLSRIQVNLQLQTGPTKIDTVVFALLNNFKFIARNLRASLRGQTYSTKFGYNYFTCPIKLPRDLGFNFAALTLTINLEHFLVCPCHVMSRDQNLYTIHTLSSRALSLVRGPVSKGILHT